MTDFTLVRLQKIESNMDTDLREPNEVLRSLHINYLEFFKHFLSIYFSVTARYWACTLSLPDNVESLIDLLLYSNGSVSSLLSPVKSQP